MDDEGWFSVTPESIAASHAAHVASFTAAVVIDCFAGVGGNAIQFAARGFPVVSVEIDPRKVDYAVNNARVYGVNTVKDKIEFVVGDFFNLAPFLKIEENYMETSLKGITTYFGDTALVPSKSSVLKKDIS